MHSFEGYKNNLLQISHNTIFFKKNLNQLNSIFINPQFNWIPRTQIINIININNYY